MATLLQWKAPNKEETKLPRINREDDLAYGRKYYQEHKEEIAAKRAPFDIAPAFLNKKKHDIGDITEARFLAKFLELGYEVFKPFSGHARSDFILEDSDGNLLKIQCKTGRLRSNSVRFMVATPASVTDQSRTKHYHGQIDYFAVHCPELNTFYLIPIDKVLTKAECSIRVCPPERATRPNSNVLDGSLYTI